MVTLDEITEVQEATSGWVIDTLNNPDAPADEREAALKAQIAFDAALDEATDRWSAIMEIEDEDERDRLIAEWEGEEEEVV